MITFLYPKLKSLSKRDCFPETMAAVMDSIAIVSEVDDNEQRELAVGIVDDFWLSIHRCPYPENQFKTFSSSKIAVSLQHRNKPLSYFIIETDKPSWEEKAMSDIVATFSLAYLPSFNQK